MSTAAPAAPPEAPDVIVPAPVTAQAAEERAKSKKLQVTDWYLSKKKL